MSAPLTFRVWDGEQMLYPGQEEHDKAFVLSQHGDLYYIRPAQIQLEGNNSVGRARWEHNGLTVMQSTGLTDSEDQEIFEADLVDGNEIYEVVWYDGGWAISPLDSDAAVRLDHNTIVSGVTVIGNRYENPELLE